MAASIKIPSNFEGSEPHVEQVPDDAMAHMLLASAYVLAETAGSRHLGGRASPWGPRTAQYTPCGCAKRLRRVAGVTRGPQHLLLKKADEAIRAAVPRLNLRAASNRVPAQTWGRSC